MQQRSSAAVGIWWSLQSALSAVRLKTALADSHVFAQARCKLHRFASESPDDSFRH
jgi:hypothetical protein